MAVVPGFIGPTNRLRSPNADVEDTINFYLEQTTPGLGKSPVYLMGTPGLNVAFVLPDSPVRALFSQDGRAFAVAGTSFFELSFVGPLLTSQFYGTVASDPNLATIVSNGSAGHQLMITSGGLVYIFDLLANTLTLVTTGLEPVTMGEFMDGYFLLNMTNSRRFGWSNLEDGTTWDPLDIAERSIASDNIVAMIRSHKEIWILGSKTSEVWIDTGDALNPFEPIQGVQVEQGCDSAYTAQRIDNSTMWKGQNSDGYGVWWKANGYTPERVSTHAVEQAMQTFGGANDRAWVYQEDGHLFVVVVMPNCDRSYVYDVAVGQWHCRARWDSTHCVWVPHVAQCHCLFNQQHLVGDRFSGAIYQQSLEFFEEQIVTAA
jgi:hypothetical protein